MGIKSKAQLEVSEDEYNYKVKNAHLQRESLSHDSAVTVIRKDPVSYTHLSFDFARTVCFRKSSSPSRISSRP